MQFEPKEIFGLSKEKIREKIIVAPESTFHVTEFFQVLMMREQADQTKKMLNLTHKQAEQTEATRHLTAWPFVFTLIVTIATLLNLAIALKWINS